MSIYLVFSVLSAFPADLVVAGNRVEAKKVNTAAGRHLEPSHTSPTGETTGENRSATALAHQVP